MDNLTPITREEMLMNDEPLTPITREEKILAGEDLECVTRREYFLKKYRHAGSEVMVEGLEVTANGTYTAPEGKAYSPVEVAVPLPDNAYLLKEASGSLVSFNDGADLPMPSFVCNIDAVQDLHGYDHPWVGGAGKNKLQVTGTSQTINGVTFTVNDDGTIKVNGTATADARFNFGTYIAKAQTQQIMNGLPDSVTDDTIKMGYQGYGAINKTTRELVIDRNVDTDWNNYTYILIQSGVTVNNLVFKPMIRLATETDPTFAPYSNICPISGHTEANVSVSGVNVWDEEWEVGALSNSIGMNYALAERIRSKNYISVKPNTPYYLYLPNTYSSARVACYDKDKTYLGQTTGGWLPVNNNTAFTTPSNAYYIRFVVVKTDETYNNDISINYPSTDTEYHAYNPNSQTIQVSWQTEAGEVFGGYIDLVSGVLTVTHKSQTGFTRGSQDSSNKLYSIGKISDMKSSNNVNVTDNYFEPLNLNDARASETPSITQYGTNLYVGGYIGKEAELDTLLETLQVKYELETPLTYQLDGNQIKSLRENNNAWCSTGDVDIDYFAKEV